MRPYSVELPASWSKVKGCIDDHGTFLSWSDMGSEYKLVVCHTPFVYVCTITKEDPKSADQTDFEDNYRN